MRYKLMGRSGLRVSKLALGTMTFGEEWGWGASEQEARRVGLGFPHNFLTDPNILDIVSGGSWERLDNHRRGR
jgi:hypothetical protein